ncbi:putative P-loop containing nucleoside triphosphate hydrolase, leucine-rich repeat domain, L [Medicago truncatula]|uniref:Putative P-loop containing nucleoside triphosphate hydrolase, leucine-rich repeat domain, L n=1 Tax=Medicago truncatula TaxID=3880 RepID=A0A396JEB5_MEDTR|nr:putative P-loop containing nucleoside triphosphate hydrolase, leucine-rich repeat domain, L [Medicago truncatula]
MDATISVAAKIAEYMVVPIGRQFGYILYYKRNLERMKTNVQKLEGTKASVQHTVDEARSNGEEIENIVQNWMNKVDIMVAEANKLTESEGHAKVQCSIGHFPNLCTRHQLSRKTKNLIQEISEVLAEGKFDRISYRLASQVTVSPFCRGYEALDSRTSMLNEILMELKNPNIFISGVYGMGGVGKTTLVKELAWQAEKDGSFGAVVMATITSSPNVENIQGQIADALDLQFNKETKEGRARQLRERIRKEKNILVILDDIWGRIDLTEVGIPFGDDYKGCKLVVTSRDLNVLNCEMGIQKEFRLEVLQQEDSWKLFEKMAGDIVHELNIKPIAVEVARCCAGLPLLIVTVAKALRKKDSSSWKDALNQLERFDQEGLHKKVYSTLELSYNCLESDDLKSLFLFIGSLGQGNIHTGILFRCYWRSGFCKHVQTLTEARNRYFNLINDLRHSSLLLELDKDRAEMHDVVRDVAKSIASRFHLTYSVKRYTQVKQWPEIDQLQKCHQIIFPWSYIEELPEKLECPELKLLVLQTIGDHLKIPDEFFSETRELKVLDLYGMMLTPTPPPSLRLLTSIQSLVLSGCVLEDISIVAELKSLEILSLEKSDITDLPKEIGQLANLRMLNLTSCSGLRFIPANLISSLTCLEELYMGNCFIQWNDVRSKDQRKSASLEELCNLSQLTTLDIMIQDVSAWPRNLQVFAKLERYNIFIGDMWKWTLEWSGGASESSRILKLVESKSTCILLDHGFNFLLNSTENLCLAKLQCVRDVLYELNSQGFPQLKHLCIQDSAELKYIVNSTGCIHPNPAFPNLETLTLENLFNLEKICHGPIPIQSLTKLKSIEVKGCEKLKNLWYSLVRDLPQLLEIKISDCKMITEIVAVQKSEADKEFNQIMFPKLRSLELERLPCLISFCSVPCTAAQFTPLALIDNKVGMPHLELLKLSNINSRKLWDDNLPGHFCIQNMRSLTIDKCDGIAYAFSSSVARELVNLKYLEFSNCQMLEDIFVSDGKLGNLPSSQKQFSDDEVIFPNLEALEISHMKHLKSIWHNKLAPNSFCKLKQLKIQFCNELSNVFPSFVLAKLQNLETVTVSDCPVLELVFETQSLKPDGGRQTSLEMQLRTLTLKHLPMLKHIWSGNPNKIFKFQNICQLKVTECKNLNHVFPLSVATELQHLQVLHIEECGIEIIVAQDEMADTNPKLIFPKLTSLSLRELTQLRSFYHASHTLDSPVLRDMDVFHCDKLLLFKSSVPIDTLPLLSIEKVQFTFQYSSHKCHLVVSCCYTQKTSFL